MNRRSKCIMVSVLAVVIATILGVTLYLLDRADAQTPPDLRNLNAAQLDYLRGAFAKVQSRGLMVEHGRLHGDDGNFCPHEKPTFLAWHRAYLIAFEGHLGSIMPYWDWTEYLHHSAFDSPTYQGGKPNPLFSGQIFDSSAGGLTDQRTERNWEALDPKYLAESVYRALTRPTFEAFQRELEAAHAMVHNTIGGAMIPVKTAAFDPIFWFHHSMVNIIWSMWSSLHKGADLSSFNNIVIDNYNLARDQTSFANVNSRDVVFPHTDTYKRAAASVNGYAGGGGLQFVALSANAGPVQVASDDPRTPHLILTLHDYTSPMDSQNIRVSLNGTEAGFTGLIGMAHRAHGDMGHVHRDRTIDLTLAYNKLMAGLGLDEVKNFTTVKVHNLMTGDETSLKGGWSLGWEVY
uniref:Tyrosinase copper-binding domain-containing protein n=1 Tax=Spongospora subterranea TaxID=70186 RepID=A0A0H5RF96_9EUKA|eukprot:CRZ12227.1 hypothetical protein [Spongospora subterranea]